MDPATRPEEAAMASALVEWRRKAANILLAANVAVPLPLVVLFLLGQGPATSPLIKSIGLTAYVGMAIMALSRRVEHTKRLCAYFVAGYVVIALSDLVSPRGPYAQIGLVANPIFALVLSGSAAARGTILASAAILVSAPFLRVLPGVARVLAIDPAQAGPQDLLWFHAAGVAALLAVLMILLNRFHGFLLDRLAALEREAAERSAAQHKVEQEMRERQRLEREIAEVGERERRRLGRELHDGVSQQVTAALLRCQALERRVERGGSVSGADFAPLTALLAETVDDAHNVALGLCPLEPDPEALAPALRMLTRRIEEMTGVRCEFRAAGDVRVADTTMAQHLYRIAQEALSNAARHAHASRIGVELCGSDRELTLQVQDNGTGLPDSPTGGMGLRTMSYRAQILEGELTVAPAPGGGIRVACRVPRPAGAPGAKHEEGEQRWIPAT